MGHWLNDSFSRVLMENAPASTPQEYEAKMRKRAAASEALSLLKMALTTSPCTCDAGAEGCWHIDATSLLAWVDGK